KPFDDIKAIMGDLTERRESKQPLEDPSCGTVFQRPPGKSAGKLIQDSGLQGPRIGVVDVSKQHARKIFRVDYGTATDYASHIDFVQAKVKELHGVTLHREVRIIGEKLK